MLMVVFVPRFNRDRTVLVEVFFCRQTKPGVVKDHDTKWFDFRREFKHTRFVGDDNASFVKLLYARYFKVFKI